MGLNRPIFVYFLYGFAAGADGIQEVSGSIPLISTKSLEIERFRGFSFC